MNARMVSLWTDEQAVAACMVVVDKCAWSIFLYSRAFSSFWFMGSPVWRRAWQRVVVCMPMPIHLRLAACSLPGCCCCCCRRFSFATAAVASVTMRARYASVMAVNYRCCCFTIVRPSVDASCRGQTFSPTGIKTIRALFQSNAALCETGKSRKYIADLIISVFWGDAENARNENTRHENAAPYCVAWKYETWKCGTKNKGWK